MHFRDLLEYIDNTRAKKEWELMGIGAMPLTPAILKQFEEDVQGYHVTSIKDAKNIINLQGKRKDISVFTKGSDGLSSGAYSDAEILFKIKGKSGFQKDSDLQSILDRNGHRWLDKYSSLVVNNEFTVPMNNILMKHYNIEDSFEVRSFISNMSNKEKGSFVKFYFSESKKLITQKLINKIKANPMENNKRNYDNDELLVHDFKIMDAFFIKEDDLDLDDFKNAERTLKMKLKTINRSDIPFIGEK